MYTVARASTTSYSYYVTATWLKQEGEVAIECFSFTFNLMSICIIRHMAVPSGIPDTSRLPPPHSPASVLTIQVTPQSLPPSHPPAGTLTIMFPDSCISAVGQRAGLPVALSCYIVLIATEGLCACPTTEQ